MEGTKTTKQHITDALKTWDHEGTSFSSLVTKEVLDQLKNFEVRDDDVWLCTYPKSGTHWVLHIMILLRFDGDVKKASEFSKNNLKSVTPLEISTPTPSGLTPAYKYYEQLPSPRIIVTHLPLHLLPKQVFEKKPKVICVARNPKDVAVSMYHFIKPSYEAADSQIGLPWDTFLETYLSDKVTNGTWFSHVLPYWQYQKDNSMLFLKYEDMKSNPIEAVRQIASFTGQPKPDNILENVVADSSVKKTKEVMDGNRPEVASMMKIGGFVRKGIVGDWKTHFKVAQSEAYDALIEKELEGTGLVMQFE